MPFLVLSSQRVALDLRAQAYGSQVGHTSRLLAMRACGSTHNQATNYKAVYYTRGQGNGRDWTGGAYKRALCHGCGLGCWNHREILTPIDLRGPYVSNLVYNIHQNPCMRRPRRVRLPVGLTSSRSV